MPEFIFTMTGVTKVHPPEKRVLENIHLAFYPGAKIGVLGVNGSGKSSLLRIMAGVDTEFIGEAKRSEEHTSELQSQFHLVCRLLLEKKKQTVAHTIEKPP